MNIRTPVLAVLLTAGAAAPLLAGPRLCGNGLPPKLSGDLFSPVECSTTTKTSSLLPGLPVMKESKEAKTDLKDLDGRWEGVLIHALGRYELLLTVKTSWGGKAELILETKEQQFRERLTDRLALVPGKERGVYAATLTTTLAPEAALLGSARIGAAVPPSLPEGTLKAPPPDRQTDIEFSNGAVHRIVFALKDKTEMRVRAFSGIPGASLQKFEVVLTRTKRETL